MAREISTPISLDHTNIIYGTEVVTVKGATNSLIRDADYIINYDLGEIKFLADGAAVQLGSLIEEFGLDVTYSYKLPVDLEEIFQSQVEVYGEIGRRVSEFEFSLTNSPLNNVSRVYNLTTQETYNVTSIDTSTVTFSGNQAPKTTIYDLANTNEVSLILDKEEKRHVATYDIVYPTRYTPSNNPTIEIISTTSQTTEPLLLVIGGQEQLTEYIEVALPLEVSDIKLFTGGRNLRTSNLILSKEEYTVVFADTLSTTDYKTAQITLSPLALQKIRTNNLYMDVFFDELLKQTGDAEVKAITQFPNEIIDFDPVTEVGTLTLLPRQVFFKDYSDVFSVPDLEVYNSSGLLLEEGFDYTINQTQNTITKTSSGNLDDNQALIYYIYKKELRISHKIVSDVVLIDYVWGDNTINWTPAIKELTKFENEYLYKNTQLLTLEYEPADPMDIKIYFETDSTKTQATQIVGYNAARRRLQVEPIPSDGNYVLEYVTRSQPIPQGETYFAEYKFGATRDVLKERYARQVGITETETPREEVQYLLAGTTSAVLSRLPVDTENIFIYKERDISKTPVVTVTGLDSVNKTLYFTSLRDSDTYVINYLTSSFDTASLRKTVTKLFENFSIGPTYDGFQNLVSAFSDEPAEIISGLTNRFQVADRSHDIGNTLGYSAFEESPPLANGESSITYVPSRFNLGALFETENNACLSIPSPTNFPINEGTIEFLVGTLFDTNDGEEHYFFDLIDDDGNKNKNRISLYKSKQGKLNFDIWDQNGRLFRATAEIAETYKTEIIELQAGDSSAVLSYPASPASLDLDTDLTPDLYEAHLTKFVIMPETPTFPADYLQQSVKVTGYDVANQSVEFEPVDFTGRYLFSYITGLPQFEEAENFIAVTWKLHTHDDSNPFYRMYINGQRIINKTLADIDFATGDSSTSRYDFAFYDIATYEE